MAEFELLLCRYTIDVRVQNARIHVLACLTHFRSLKLLREHIRRACVIFAERRCCVHIVELRVVRGMRWQLDFFLTYRTKASITGVA